MEEIEKQIRRNEIRGNRLIIALIFFTVGLIIINILQWMELTQY